MDRSRSVRLCACSFSSAIERSNLNLNWFFRTQIHKTFNVIPKYLLHVKSNTGSIASALPSSIPPFAYLPIELLPVVKIMYTDIKARDNSGSNHLLEVHSLFKMSPVKMYDACLPFDKLIILESQKSDILLFRTKKVYANIKFKYRSFIVPLFALLYLQQREILWLNNTFLAELQSLLRTNTY